MDIIGLATVSLTLVKSITTMIKPSKALYIQHPFGLTLGDIGDSKTHEAVLKSCIEHAFKTYPAGAIIDLPFIWTKNDLRARQLKKEAH